MPVYDLSVEGQHEFTAEGVIVHNCASRDMDEQAEWIIAADHRRMPMGTDKGLLDWDFTTKKWVGVLDEWWQIGKDIGIPITHVVAEYNAAQRHLFQRSNVVNRWQLQRGVRIVAHSTSKNKNDPKLGVEALIPIRYQLGAVRIPWRPGSARNTMQALYDEAKGYQAGSPTDDIIMAQWFRWLNRRKCSKPLAPVAQEGEFRKTGLEWAASTPGWVSSL